MNKIILDTNIFISALLSPEGICRKIVRFCFEEKVQPLMGDALFNEYEDVLSRTQLFVDCPVPNEEREELLDAFSTSCEWVKIFYKWRPNLRDEGDNHLIELAVAGNAQIIVTRNVRDLKSGELKFERLRILTPEEFMKEKQWE